VLDNGLLSVTSQEFIGGVPALAWVSSIDPSYFGRTVQKVIEGSYAVENDKFFDDISTESRLIQLATGHTTTTIAETDSNGRPIIADGRNLYNQKVVEKMQALSPETKKMIVTIAALAAAIGPLLFGLGAIISLMPILAGGFAAITGPIGLTILAVVALVGGLTLFMNKSKDVTDEVEKGNVKIREETSAVKALFDQLRFTNSGQQRRSDLIKEINSNYGTHLKDMKDEKTFAEQLGKAYETIVTNLAQKIRLEANSKQLAVLINKQDEISAQKELYEIETNRLVNMGGMSEAMVRARENATKLFDITISGIERQKQALLSKGAKLIVPGVTGAGVTGAGDGGAGDPKKFKGKGMEEWFIGDPDRIDRQFSTVKDIGLRRIADLKDTFKGKDLGLAELFKDETKRMSQALAELTKQINDALQSFVTDTIVGFASKIGEALAGAGDPFKDFGKTFLESLGKLMVQIGSLMIAWGVAQKRFLESMFTNPAMAIAAGIALVAIGSAIAATSRRGLEGAGGGGGGGDLGTGGGMNVTLEPVVLDTRISGSDIWLSNSRADLSRRRVR